jgi:hypothetical protein
MPAGEQWLSDRISVWGRRRIILNWPFSAIEDIDFQATSITALRPGPDPASMDETLAAVDPRRNNSPGIGRPTDPGMIDSRMPGHEGFHRRLSLGPQIFDTLVGFALAQFVMGVLLDAHLVAFGHVLKARSRPQ